MKYQKLNRSFARRIGKSFTPNKKEFLDKNMESLRYSKAKLENATQETKILEIGFGMGEHFLHQAKENPDNLYIGAEVYLNGVYKVAKHILQEQVDNAILWPDDIDEILQLIPDNSLNGIYVLFPDPWHKKKYLKKRIFNKERMQDFKRILKPNGFISFASDIEDYFEDAKNILAEDGNISIKNTDYLTPHSGYIQTKYHSKAIEEGRQARFVTGYCKC